MQKVSIMPLGAGCQVGRSCIILTVNEKKIMLDCGLSISKEGHDALPLLDKINSQQLSMVIITHAHLDHCGALPYFLGNYKYKKKVFMTRPTCDIYKYLVNDTLKLKNQQALFTEQQIEDSLRKIVKVDFGVQVEEQGIKITPYVAGHIVGAAMFLVEVDGVKILYTGDYSCEEDRYIMKAQVPQTNVDILIAQSTFGTRQHDKREIRQQQFLQQVSKIVLQQKGKCLLPVFSAGRAEQLLFMLDEYWDQHKEQLGHIKIYYTVSLIQNCKDIYETYIDMLSKKIRQRFYKQISNPFKYRYIHYLRRNQNIFSEQKNPMVVMCTPGMLQSGQSRTLLQKWCHDPRNGVIITGYCAQGSIASNLKKGDSIPSMNDQNKFITVNIKPVQISFAAHADYAQTTQFIKKVKPMYVVLVHGSSKNAQALRASLQQQFPQIKEVRCPKNEQALQFDVQITQRYLLAGQLKNKIEGMFKQNSTQAIQKREGTSQEFQGYIVNTGDHKIIVDEKDKDKFFPYLQRIHIYQKIKVNYVGGLTLAQLLAFRIFKDAETCIKDGDEVLYIKKKSIMMRILQPGKTAIVEFRSSPKNDIIADQFCFLLSNILFDPFLEKSLEEQQFEFTKQYKIILQIIQDQYPESTLSEGMLAVRKDNQNIAMLNLYNRTVDTINQYLFMRLSTILEEYLGNCNKLQQIVINDGRMSF